MHNAEYRRDSAEVEGQRQDDDRGEPWRLTENTPGVAEVLHHAGILDAPDPEKSLPGVALFLLAFFLLLLLPIALPVGVAGHFVTPQLPPHHRQCRLRDSDFMRQYFNHVLVACAPRVAVLPVQFLQIAGRL